MHTMAWATVATDRIELTLTLFTLSQVFDRVERRWGGEGGDDKFCCCASSFSCSCFTAKPGPTRPGDGGIAGDSGCREAAC